MKLVLQNDAGETIDTYEDVELCDLEDPDSPAGLAEWLKAGIESGKVQRQEYFVITRVHRDDLQQAGIDASEWPDDKMIRLAGKMENDYLEQLYWSSLEILAEGLSDD